MAIFHSYVKLPEGNPHPLGISILRPPDLVRSGPPSASPSAAVPPARRAQWRGPQIRPLPGQRLPEGHQLVPQLAQVDF